MWTTLLAGILALLILTACGSAGLTATSTARPVAPGDRPNFLLIITDDQRYDTMDYMPRTQARVFGEGVTFTAGYVTTPNCCPSRSSVLTGMYAHTHGAHRNQDPLLEPTFVASLHEAGYVTGISGKYLNSWAREDPDEPPRPEFDFWVAFGSVPEEDDYFDPTLNVAGSWTERQGYFTHILRDEALAFLEGAEDQDAPFLLIFAPYAPHKPADPAPGDEDLYTDLPLHRPPSHDEADVSDKPDTMARRPQMAVERIEELDAFRLKQLRSLNAVDEAVESLLDELEAQGELDETVVIYLSDNGVFWGEHRVGGKNLAYEEAIHVPFALRYPPLVPPSGGEPRVEPRLVANIDIAPTIYELAGLPIPPGVDGRSLVPLLQGTDDWREDLLIENWDGGKPRFQAVHTGRYVYIRQANGDTELYDLSEDPYQLENLSGDIAVAATESDLRARLEVALEDG